jgi:hypothetical protein
MRLLVIALAALLAACTGESSQRASAGDSPRCELSPGAGGCRTADRPRPDENWRTSGFGGY